MIKLTTAALLTALAVPAALASGCHGPRHHDLNPARLDAQITEHLDDYLDDARASDAQRARIMEVKRRLLPEGVALATSHHQVAREVAEQLASNTPDRARLHTLVDQQADAARAFAHKAVDGVLEAHGALTPEQRAPMA